MLRIEAELSDKKVRKAMDKANRKNIQKTIVLGESELTKKRKFSFILKRFILARVTCNFWSS